MEQDLNISLELIQSQDNSTAVGMFAQFQRSLW